MLKGNIVVGNLRSPSSLSECRISSLKVRRGIHTGKELNFSSYNLYLNKHIKIIYNLSAQLRVTEWLQRFCFLCFFFFFISDISVSCSLMSDSFATPWTVARQAPLSMKFSWQEYWSGQPFPSPGNLPNPRIEPRSPAFLADSLSSQPPGKHFSTHYIKCKTIKPCIF